MTSTTATSATVVDRFVRDRLPRLSSGHNCATTGLNCSCPTG